MVIERFKTGRRPYRILFHPDGKSFFVTSWTDGTLGHYETANGNQLASVRLGPHPTDMVWRAGKNDRRRASFPGRRGFSWPRPTPTACIRWASPKARSCAWWRSSTSSMTPRQPLGMTPSALALSPDGNRLFTVCSDANAVAVADVSLRPQPRAGLHPHRLVSHRRARAEGRHAGGAERPRRRSQPNPNGRTRKRRPVHGQPAPNTWRASRPARRRFIPPFDDKELGGLHEDRAGELALPRQQAGPAAHAAAGRARDLHRQGKPHLRPGAAAT